MHEPIISADGYVGEAAEMWARVPQPYRDAAMTRRERRPDGSWCITLMGMDIVVPRPAVEIDAELKQKEFRNDKTAAPI